jgi:hypothetical protein
MTAPSFPPARASRVLVAPAALAALAALPWACGGDGDGARVDPSGDAAIAGRWKPARRASVEEKIDHLEAIGYAAGSTVAGAHANVTAHDRAKAYQGLNLYVSGHAPEAILMDMSGEELHRWRLPYHEAVPDTSIGDMEHGLYRDFWRRAHLFENGDLLAIFEGHALVKLDARSKLLWTFVGKPHHDLFLDDEGRIYVLTRKAHVIPRLNPDEPVLEDFVSVLDPDGNELRRVSVLECFENSELTSFVARLKKDGDILHTNTLELVDERLASRLPGVEVGNVLVSCLFLNSIAILDLDAKKVVWALHKDWVWQHQPTVLDDGNILMLDNLGGDKRFGRSRVIELDPVTEEVTWTYRGEPSNPFETSTCGSCQRLPNGNTLITESDNGRAIEVDRAGEIVWEFLNPYRAGEQDELVATLFEMIRLEPDFPVDWIER